MSIYIYIYTDEVRPVLGCTHQRRQTPDRRVSANARTRESTSPHCLFKSVLMLFYILFIFCF